MVNGQETRPTLPTDFRFALAVQVYPDETIAVNMYVNWEQAVLSLVETVQFLVTRCFGQLAIESV